MKGKPDVIVSDISMPGEDGYSLIRKIRVLEEGSKSSRRVPAVALTAYARPEDRDRALAAGYQVHVAKPVGKEEVISTVTAVVGT
jgi:CheY-like chemotaxis protein